MINVKETENFVELWGTISSVKSLNTITEIKNDLNLYLLEYQVNDKIGTSMHSFKTTLKEEIALHRCTIRLLFQKNKLKTYQVKL